MRLISERLDLELALASRSWKATCDRTSFLVGCGIGVAAIITRFAGMPAMMRSEIGPLVLREAGTQIGMLSMSLIGLLSYLRVGEDNRGQEALDLSRGLGFWSQHVAATLVAVRSAVWVWAAVTIAVVLGTALAGGRGAAVCESALWSAGAAVSLGGVGALVQVVGMVMKLSRQPLLGAFVGVGVLIVGYHVAMWHEAISIGPIRLLMGAVIPDFDWLESNLLSMAYAPSLAALRPLGWIFAGFLTQIVALCGVVAVLPLSSAYLEKRNRVVVAKG